MKVGKKRSVLNVSGRTDALFVKKTLLLIYRPFCTLSSTNRGSFLEIIVYTIFDQRELAFRHLPLERRGHVGQRVIDVRMIAVHMHIHEQRRGQYHLRAFTVEKRRNKTSVAKCFGACVDGAICLLLDISESPVLGAESIQSPCLTVCLF
jgi:hypothetical protein